MATKKATKKSVSKSEEFAVISTGGKQYKVSAGDVLVIEKLPGTYSAGDEIVFDKVLLVDNGKDTTIGTPHISGAKVTASFIENGRHQKVIVMKYKPKSRYKKTNGHRQEFTKVKITVIK
ncbi:50S ribosomal protein L21 [Candidatus Nomurabacteria bacterium]|nr:MAG: 50S ribosomal protein L21 [Candidatus Nomurabacteria bacterium]